LIFKSGFQFKIGRLKMGNDMTAPFVLSLIAGVLILLNSIVAIAMAALGSAAISAGVAAAGSSAAASALAGAMAGSVFTIIMATGIVGIIFGLVVLLGAVWMKKPEKAKKGSIIVLVLSIISIFTGGGFILGLILGIIGGAIGLSKSK
jgi:ABC-type Mn2+/Zn2+ transport system permease subunit